MMAESSEKVYCVPCCAKREDKCFANTTLHSDLSHMHVLCM